MIRAFQWDLARQVERLDWLLAQLPRYAEWGYQELYLHMEDAMEFPSLPGVARADAYSYRQMQQLVEAATDVGIKVVPIVNLLGHTQYLIKVPEFRDLNELRAPDGSPLERGQICPLHPRTLGVAEKLIRDVLPFCTAGRVHVGLDESFHLGKHALSRNEIRRIGLAAHFAGYVQRLHRLAAQSGLQLGIWADMLYFLPGAIPLLPADISVYEWYYYPFSRRPRVELFNFAESDVGEKLRARGLSYWGCPMNGAFRHEPMPHFRDRLENILSWWRHCQRMNAAGFLVTGWEPNRLALELTTVIDAAAATLWLEPEAKPDPERMLARGFERVFGVSSRPREAARAALSCDRFPFGGYPRWEINTRWDTLSPREPLEPYRAEEKFFRQLSRRAKNRNWPAPLRSSLEFRHYLAVREVRVREFTRGDARDLRLPVATGLQAARSMWNRTRDRKADGPNLALLRADATRAKNLPATAPRWWLSYVIENFAPAAQLVAVEIRHETGAWETLQACHTIEFQARAARPRGGLARFHAAPIQWDGRSESLPEIRLALRGLGQVSVRKLELTDGRVALHATTTRSLLGRPAPRRGFPVLDWTQNQDVLAVRIRPRQRRL
jgi:hypothetical protein